MRRYMKHKEQKQTKKKLVEITRGGGADKKTGMSF